MPHINLTADPKLLPHVIRFVKNIVLGDLKDKLAFSPDFHNEDPDLTAIYMYDLQEVLTQDCQHLLFVLEDTRLGKQPIPIEIELGDPTLRAASAVRMFIRNAYLKNVTDTELESGKLSFDELKHNIQLAYACYVFLAALQEAILQSLDPQLS